MEGRAVNYETRENNEIHEKKDARLACFPKWALVNQEGTNPYASLFSCISLFSRVS
jgi:hypothetical protein